MGYNPRQPRDPAGTSTGGQWSKAGAAAMEAAGLNEWTDPNAKDWDSWDLVDTEYQDEKPGYYSTLYVGKNHLKDLMKQVKAARIEHEDPEPIDAEDGGDGESVLMVWLYVYTARQMAKANKLISDFMGRELTPSETFGRDLDELFDRYD